MNKKWNRPRFATWNGGNNNQFGIMPQYSNDWSPKSWHSSASFKRQRNDFQFRQQRNQNNNSRNNYLGRWETMQHDEEFDFSNNITERNGLSQISDGDFIPFASLKEEKKKDIKPFQKCCRSILQEDLDQLLVKMEKTFWDKLDPKEDIRLLCKENSKNIVIPAYDGVTPRGLDGVIKAWHCGFCSVVFLDLENKNLHLMQKKHYSRYANFCKKYADEEIMKLGLKKKDLKKKSKRSTKNTDISVSEIDAEHIDEDEVKIKKIGNKDKKKGQDRKSKLLPPKVDHSLSEAISIEEELNYDFLE